MCAGERRFHDRHRHVGAILALSAAEFRLALFAAAAVPCIGVEQGILLAIVLSLIGHVRHSYRPHITLLTPNASGLWEPTAARPGQQTAPGLIVYRFGADLFYANVDRFADKARELIATAPSPVRGFVIDAGALTDIDFSAGRTFRDLLAELKDRQIDVVMGRVSADLRADLERHGIVEALGAEIHGTLFGAACLAFRRGTAAWQPKYSAENRASVEGRIFPVMEHPTKVGNRLLAALPRAYLAQQDA